MIALGALSAAVAACCVVLATRTASGVERALRSVSAPVERHGWVGLVRRGIGATSRDGSRSDRVLGMRLAGAIVGCLCGIVLAVATGWGPILIVVTTYAGAITPSLLEDRRAARERHEASRAVVWVVEWIHALVASGRPIEPAIVAVASHGTRSARLDACLAAISRDYTLGVPMHAALARNGREWEISAIADLAMRIERSRDLGRGVSNLVQDLRDELRASERARSLEMASQVEGKLTLVLTLCYLPALALLVIIPLFLTLLSGLFGT